MSSLWLLLLQFKQMTVTLGVGGGGGGLIAQSHTQKNLTPNGEPKKYTSAKTESEEDSYTDLHDAPTQSAVVHTTNCSMITVTTTATLARKEFLHRNHFAKAHLAGWKQQACAFATVPTMLYGRVRWGGL